MKFLKSLMVGLVMFSGSQAMAEEYRLRAGDALEIVVWQDQKLNKKAIVGPDGFIAVSLAGRFNVAGKTAGDAEKLIKERLQPKYVEDLDVTVSYLESPKKDPTTAKAAEWTVYVTGEVAKPGAFAVTKSPPSVLQAIALSGGIGPFGAAKRVQIHRKVNGAEYVYEFDYTRYEKGENLEGNITLRNGDVIVVPEKKIFE